MRWNRGLRQWKTTTLADFARVSVSTVERVERGERVSVEALDRIAQAFGYEAGYFTAPRIPLPPEEAAADMVEQFSHLEPVPVVPIKTHRIVREAARCHAFLIHRPDVPDSYDADLEALQEWLDLASFVLSDLIDHGSSSEGRRRELYNNILGCVSELERRGLTVLLGVMEAPQEGFPDWKVAVVSITPKLTDPGATKRQHLMVDRRPPRDLRDDAMARLSLAKLLLGRLALSGIIEVDTVWRPLLNAIAQHTEVQWELPAQAKHPWAVRPSMAEQRPLRAARRAE